MKPEGLARLWHLTQPTLPSKSGYFAIDTSTEHGRYWAWCLDDAAKYCAWWLEREADAKKRNPNYEPVVPERT